MGGSCSRVVDDPGLGRIQRVQWPTAVTGGLRDVSRAQGHRITPSSVPLSRLGIHNAVASTNRTCRLNSFSPSFPSSLSSYCSTSSTSFSSPSPSLPSSCDSKDVLHGSKSRKLQFDDDAEGPKLSMLAQDFVVTSSIHEHLLLMIALSRKVPKPDSSFAEDDHTPIARKARRPRVFKGNFTALSRFVTFNLGRDAQRVLYEPNAGGSSSISESLSVEYFARRFQARDVVTEMEVEYCMKNWKKVDYICTLYGERVGVSVTRAMSYPDPDQFSKDSAYKLLYKKLFGLVVARHGVKKKHNFSRCILHIWCETPSAAKLLELLYPSVSEELELIDDVIMVLTVAEGKHGRPIFYEHRLRSHDPQQPKAAD